MTIVASTSLDQWTKWGNRSTKGVASTYTVLGFLWSGLVLVISGTSLTLSALVNSSEGLAALLRAPATGLATGTLLVALGAVCFWRAGASGTERAAESPSKAPISPS